MAYVALWTVLAGITGATWLSFAVAVGTGLLVLVTYNLVRYTKKTAGQAQTTTEEAKKTSNAPLAEQNSRLP